ncbi:MAG: cysteine synthase A [Christensenellaceae bacterium]|nr:cysteine synthase A [Christensenellaceae bacterium]
MNILETIGGTPLVKLNSIGSSIYVKMERVNPAGSIKDRPAYKMIKEAIAKGELTNGMKIVEPTSGNMGIALALIGKQLGFEVVLVMPDTMSIERRKLMEGYGASLILTGAGGMQASVDKAMELVASGGYYMPDQFNNPANLLSHYESTGPEIYKALPKIKGFVAGIGTGGTLSGVGKYLKSQDNQIQIWGLEPKESPLISKGECGLHGIQGIGANFIPGNYRKEYVDRVITVSSPDAIAMAKRLSIEEGLAVGISAGANVLGAVEMERELGGPVVTVLPDGAEKYLSTALFE